MVDPFCGVPQSVQLDVISRFCTEKRGEIVFYGSEDVLTRRKFLFLKSKVQEQKVNFDTIGFYSLEMLVGCESPTDLLRPMQSAQINLLFALERKYVSYGDLLSTKTGSLLEQTYLFSFAARSSFRAMPDWRRALNIN